MWYTWIQHSWQQFSSSRVNYWCEQLKAYNNHIFLRIKIKSIQCFNFTHRFCFPSLIKFYDKKGLKKKTLSDSFKGHQVKRDLTLIKMTASINRWWWCLLKNKGKSFAATAASNFSVIFSPLIYHSHATHRHLINKAFIYSIWNASGG